ncbi:MAG TPA: toll/interleukin-1 receptor domain-containing protein [Candidatus Polarisedimenticolia bacterium]|nr:toll/interleukin-1 receptor domain-containing protein [Candidatus Polarisedimenticolia bacterium]
MPLNGPIALTAFFSYSRADSVFALRLAEDLKVAGANVWIDQIDIQPGQEWDSAVEAAVTQAPQMLLILSPASVKSRNVRNEISFALEENKTILPVLYQDCIVPLQLHRIQHIDFRADYKSGLKTLLSSLGVESPSAANRRIGQQESMAEQRILQDVVGQTNSATAGQSEERRKRSIEKAPLQEADINRVQPAAENIWIDREEKTRWTGKAGLVPESQLVREELGGNSLAKHSSSWVKRCIAVFATLLVSWGVYTRLLTSRVDKQNKPNLTQQRSSTRETGSSTLVASSSQEDVAAAKAMYTSGAYSSAVPLLQRAVENGSAEAKFLLSLHYDATVPAYTGVDKDPRKAAELCRSAAEAGISDAMASLGADYAEGVGVDKDYQQALSWLRKAADAGNGEGMAGLAAMSQAGWGEDKDYRQALIWSRKAIDAGSVIGMVQLGDMYQLGYGVPQDYVQAVTLYRQAAEAQNAILFAREAKLIGMVHLGFMYQEGRGVPKSHVQALSWYRKAADGSSATGMSALGAAYAKGIGVEKNYPLAIAWFRKAASCYDPSAMNYLGYIYEKGLGAKADPQQARTWYRKASQFGSQEATDALKRLGTSP